MRECPGMLKKSKKTEKEQPMNDTGRERDRECDVLEAKRKKGKRGR